MNTEPWNEKFVSVNEVVCYLYGWSEHENTLQLKELGSITRTVFRQFCSNPVSKIKKSHPSFEPELEKIMKIIALPLSWVLFRWKDGWE